VAASAIRAERTSLRAGVAPAEVQRLSRALFRQLRGYFYGSGANTGIFGCVRKRSVKSWGRTPDHGGGVYPIG
jgi:hypothetical protein